MRRWLVAVDREDHFLDERAQQLLPIAGGGRRCIPDDGQVGPESEQMLAFLLAQDAGALLQTAGEFVLRSLQIRQALLPLALEPAGDEPVIGVNSKVAPLSAAGLIGRA